MEWLDVSQCRWSLHVFTVGMVGNGTSSVWFSKLGICTLDMDRQ